MKKTIDERRHFHNADGTVSFYHLQVFTEPGRTPVVIVSDLPGAMGTLSEDPVKWLANRIWRHILNEPEEMTWIEHFPETSKETYYWREGVLQGGKEERAYYWERFCEVTFDKTSDGLRNPRRQPPMAKREVEALIGQPFVIQADGGETQGDLT